MEKVFIHSLRSCVRILVIAALLTCQFNSVHADEPLEGMLQLSLEELMAYEVVTPTRTSLRLAESPGSVTLITYDQIQRSSAQTIPELLRMVAGVNVRWNPMVQTMDIRGFGASPFTSQVLLMIDGVPYNSWNKGGFPQHPGFDFFNLANVKHIEIVRGPGSALYGENAFNGVINIITLSGADVSNARVSSAVGSRDTRTLSFSQGKQFSEQTDLFGNIRRNESQLPLSLWAEEQEAEARGYDLFLKFRHKGFQATYYRLEDTFEGFEHDVGSPGLPPGSVFRSAEEIEQTIDILGLQYFHEAESGKWSFTANASHAQRDGSHCGACHAPAQAPEFLESEDHGFQTYLHTQLTMQVAERHELLVGLEGRRIDAGDHSHELHGHDATNPAAPGHDESVHDYEKVSGFVQDRITLLDNKLQFVLGVRFEGATSPSLFGSDIFPRISAVYMPNDALTFRMNWGPGRALSVFQRDVSGQLVPGCRIACRHHSAGRF